MNPKVSILVPMFNVSKYIERSARSIFEQTFDDIEFIFVDDSSTDNSIEKLKKVIDEYPSRRNNIKIIRNSQNKGIATSRNIAIDLAIGDYIAFVDSDDYVEKEMVAELYEFALNNNADIVVFDSIFEYGDKKEYISDELSLNNVENIELVLSQKISHSIWNKFSKSKLFKMEECRAPNGLNFGEDFHISVRLFYFAENIHKLNKCYYHYNCLNEGSITKKVTEMHFENAIRFWNLVEEFLKVKNIFERCQPSMDIPKAQRKLRLVLDTTDSKLRKKYAEIFQQEELRCLTIFTRGERFFLWLLRKKLYFLFEVFHKIMIIKNQLRRISKKLY